MTDAAVALARFLFLIRLIMPSIMWANFIFPVSLLSSHDGAMYRTRFTAYTKKSTRTQTRHIDHFF